MKKLLLLIIVLSSVMTLYSKHVVTVCDNNDKSPIVKVSALSSKGMILGFTDSEGKIRIPESAYPVSFQSMGYEPITMEHPGDSVFMLPVSYPLSEVVITPGETPITRIVAFVREYATCGNLSDSLQIYQEFMVEYFFAEGKVKGYKKSDANGKVRNAMCFSRFINADGNDSNDSICINDNKEIYSVFVPPVPEYAILLFGNVSEPPVMREGAVSDTLQGKFSPKYIRTKRNNLFIIDHDLLSESDGHRWENPLAKVLGFSSEISIRDFQVAYRLKESGEYDHRDMVYSSFRSNLTAKGHIKWSKRKKPIDLYLDSFIETFPVLIENITIPEYKEMKRSQKNEKLEFRKPENLPPLPLPIERLAERGLYDSLY